MNLLADSEGPDQTARMPSLSPSFMQEDSFSNGAAQWQYKTARNEYVNQFAWSALFLHNSLDRSIFT